jgi:hypothetical protein
MAKYIYSSAKNISYGESVKITKTTAKEIDNNRLKQI